MWLISAEEMAVTEGGGDMINNLYMTVLAGNLMAASLP